MEEVKNESKLPPENNLVWAIIATLLCCWPFGIPAIISASKVDRLWAAGCHNEAVQAAADAKKWATIAAVVAGVCWAFYVLVLIVLAIAGEL